MPERMSNPTKEYLQPKNKEIKELNKITSAAAQRIFENAMINTINEELSTEDRISSSDGTANLRWLVDEASPEGRFAIVQRNLQKKSMEENKSYVLEKDTETGETYQVEKLSGPFEPQGETSTVYDLNANEVKKIFNKLEPAVRDSFIGGWKDSLLENIKLTEKFRQELRQEKRQEKREELENQIKEHEEAQEEIRKKIKALA